MFGFFNGCKTKELVASSASCKEISAPSWIMSRRMFEEVRSHNIETRVAARIEDIHEETRFRIAGHPTHFIA